MGELNDTLSDDFMDFIVCLSDVGVDVVLVGGYALGVHGVVRATGDIDFLYRRTADNVRRLCTAMATFGAPSDIIDFDALMKPAMVTMFGTPPYRIDLLSEITGVTFGKVWAGSLGTDIQGQIVRVIGPVELRANKLATGRTKDALDARKLAKLNPAPATKAATKKSAPKRPRTG